MTRLLIVDDEPEITVLVKMILGREGHEIDGASDGKEGFEKLKKEKYDMILLDVRMPGGLDGWEVCKKIKADEKTRDIPVVMFTVYNESWAVEKGRECGATAQVNKPFEIEDLVTTVDKALNGSYSSLK